MKKDSKTPLFENEEEILNQIMTRIDKYIKRTGKGQKHVNDLRARIEKKLHDINPNVTDSSIKKTYKNVLDKQDESKNLQLSDIERLLEYIQEEEKQEPKSKKEKETPKPKEEEPVSPSKAIEKFQNSTAASNLKADLKRMSSRGDKIQAILQLLRSLPGISDTAIRRAIVNAFKTKN
jgi:hypothetical protein